MVSEHIIEHIISVRNVLLKHKDSELVNCGVRLLNSFSSFLFSDLFRQACNYVMMTHFNH